MACLLALPHSQVAASHVSLLRGDNLIQKFEEKSSSTHVLIVDPCLAHHDENKVYDTRSRTVCRFQLFKHAKGQFEEFEVVIKFKLAIQRKFLSLISRSHLKLFLPAHSVRKEPSTTTEVQTVFDASANISTGFSLNKTLLVGPMVHYSLIDVLWQFRLNRILTADVSWMYRAIALVEFNKDLRRFVWRTSLHGRVKTFA